MTVALGDERKHHGHFEGFGMKGAIAGVLLFVVLDASFNMLGVPAFAKHVIRGVICRRRRGGLFRRTKGHVL